jgi:hypothetical protein
MPRVAQRTDVRDFRSVWQLLVHVARDFSSKSGDEQTQRLDTCLGRAVSYLLGPVGNHRVA